MRRSVVALFVVFVGLTLLAAAPDTSILGKPVLVVYPFTANGSDVSKEAGSRLAVTIATQIANLGGVDVRPAPAGVERQNYVDAAHSAGADYYIAGYVTPLGDGVSVVEQLVSTLTGIVVFSNTAQVRTYGDAAGQGDILREALLRHQTRNLDAYTATPPPAPSPSASSAAGAGPQANLGRLFARKHAAATAAPSAPPATIAPGASAATIAAAPAPSPTPSAAVKRGSAIGVLAIGGTADDERRAFTGAALRNDLVASHRSVEGGGTRESACSRDDVGTLLSGNLATREHTVLGHEQTAVTLELLASDCAGNVLYRKIFAKDAGGDWKDTVDGLVAGAVGAFLREPAANPRG